MAVTYRWQVGSQPIPRDAGYRAFVHFVAADGALLLTDDHEPLPPPEAWEPGATYEYTRVVFTHEQFPGPLQVRLCLHDRRDGRRAAMKAPPAPQAAYPVGTLDVLRRRSDRRPLFFSGFSEPWTRLSQPFESFRGMGREAVIACRNPRADAVLFLKASTAVGSFPSPPTLRVSVGGTVRELGLTEAGSFTVAVPLDARHLGRQEYTDVTLSMSATFREDGREHGLTVERAILLPQSEVPGDLLGAAIVL